MFIYVVYAQRFIASLPSDWLVVSEAVSFLVACFGFIATL